ncbi:cytochrome b [Maricurvus nonylphenolicus]|uniref:cytochrome b n=1 Tax=Maricurvus nonylphenolicus TaxID=1008307 RepID=UPI0036F296F5
MSTLSSPVNRSGYSLAQKTLHWLMALCICLDLVVARKFGGDMELWDRLESRGDHASLNLIVLGLFILRLYFRFKQGSPAPLAGPAWQVRLAQGTHMAIYFFLAALFATGLATAMHATSAVVVFGEWSLSLGNLDEGLFLSIRQLHEFSTQAILVLITLHVVGALYHQIVLRDGVMSRMLKSSAKEAKDPVLS